MTLPTQQRQQNLGGQGPQPAPGANYGGGSRGTFGRTSGGPQWAGVGGGVARGNSGVRPISSSPGNPGMAIGSASGGRGLSRLTGPGSAGQVPNGVGWGDTARVPASGSSSGGNRVGSFNPSSGLVGGGRGAQGNAGATVQGALGGPISSGAASQPSNGAASAPAGGGSGSGSWGQRPGSGQGTPTLGQKPSRPNVPATAPGNKQAGPKVTENKPAHKPPSPKGTPKKHGKKPCHGRPRPKPGHKPSHPSTAGKGQGQQPQKPPSHKPTERPSKRLFRSAWWLLRHRNELMQGVQRIGHRHPRSISTSNVPAEILEGISM